MMRSSRLPFLFAILSLATATTACGPGDNGDGSETPTPASNWDTPTPSPQALLCTEPLAVDCEDELILDLGFVSGKVSDGAITTTTTGDHFATEVDATAGGFQNAADNPWIYMRFTPGGGEKVDVDDLESLDSMDWHIAFKRYEIRINSGTSGPSCVSATTADGNFEDVTQAPDNAAFVVEDFFDDDCNMISDDKGLGGADVALGPWWAYNGCVNTTGQVFVVELDTGELVKLVIDAYYAEGQQTCNTSGTMGSGSANLAMRWAYL